MARRPRTARRRAVAGPSSLYAAVITDPSPKIPGPSAPIVDRSVIDRLVLVWSSIAGLCGDLTVEQWALDTECPGWSVQDQLAHLVGTESDLAGRARPPAPPTDLPHVRNPIGESNEAWVEAFRRQSGAEVLAAFEQLTTERAAALRAMSDEELATDGPSPIGVVPYITFMDVRTMDCWVHEQDIRWAVGEPGHLDGPAADAALDRLTGSFGFVVGKRVAPAEGTSVVLALSGPAPRTLAVRVDSGRAHTVDPPSRPTVALSTDVGIYVRLAAGRLEGDEALDQGLVAVSGDPDLARRVCSSLSIMP